MAHGDSIPNRRMILSFRRSSILQTPGQLSSRPAIHVAIKRYTSLRISKLTVCSSFIHRSSVPVNVPSAVVVKCFQSHASTRKGLQSEEAVSPMHVGNPRNDSLSNHKKLVQKQ